MGERPDIDAILARCEAATPGPWRADGHHGCKQVRGRKTGAHRQAQYQTEVCWTPGLSDEHEDYANAEFIAHARTDVPALCDEVAALRAENERLREAHHRLHRLFDATNADRAHAEAERDARLPVIDGPLPDASRVPTRVYAVAIDDTECPWTVWNSEDRGWVNDDNGENWDADRVPVVRYIPFPPWDGSLTEAE